MNMHDQDGPNWRALLLVAGLHLLVAVLLLSIKPVADAIGLPQPLMVSLLTMPAPEPAPQQVTEPPKPLPASVHKAPPLPVRPQTLLASQTEIPAPASAPAPVPAEVPAASSDARPAAVAAAPASSAGEPAPVSAPRFDADYLDNPAPAYPPLSRKLGEQGQVLLHVFVAADGHAGKVDIRDSSGFERLDRAARDAVQRWRFTPARQGDKTVAAWVLVPISFSLRS